MREKAVIKTDKPKELVQLALCRGLRKLPENSHCVLQKMYALAVNLVSQKFQLCDTQFALNWVDDDTVVLESLKDQPYM